MALQAPGALGANGMQRLGRNVLVIALGAAALAGCSSIRDHRGYIIDPALLDSVQVEVDNQQSVERTLGRPTFISQFGEPAWYYVSVNTRQAAFTRPRTYGQLVTRIKFDPKGNVVAVDRATTEKVVRLDPDGGKTPTLGRERTFLEDLFGNIGTVGAGGAGPGAGGAGGPGG
jgi:outer membrane protein assembly factor BamE (lipoprotein component of BamABCDE complex)